MAYDQQAPYPLMVKFMDEYVGTNYLTKSANREFKWLQNELERLLGLKLENNNI